MDQQPIKVLFVAFGCEPARGSEPGCGWHFVDEASCRRPVWVITHADHRKPMDHYLATQHKHYPIHPIYVKLPGMEWLRNTHLGVNVYYYLWQFVAAIAGRKVHQKEKFDIVQHVSFVRYWMQSAGAFIGAPFIFGPVGGGEFLTDSLKSELTFCEHIRQNSWKVIRSIMEWDPFFRITLRRSRAVIASGEKSRHQFRRLGIEPIDVMSVAAPAPKLPPVCPGPAAGEPFRFVSIGTLARWKGVHLGIQAFAKAFGPESGRSDANVEYIVIGEGENLNHLKKLSRELGVSDKVRFEGNLPYEKCLQHLAGAGAMVHPALRDSAGLVFESLLLGVPVASVDIGTAALLIDADSGAVIPTANGAAAVVSQLAAVMLRWKNNPAEYRRLRQGAVARSQEMSRQRRGDKLDAIYARVLAGDRFDPRADAPKSEERSARARRLGSF